MADVFISFADEEKKIALATMKLLKRELGSVTVFVSADPWQIAGGERWLDRIEREIRSAKVVLLLLSSRSVNRPWINFEAGAAWLNRSVVIPVCFGGLAIRELPKPYGDFQAIQLDVRDQMYPLVRSVSQGIGEPIAPIPFPENTNEVVELREALAQVAKEREATSRRPASVELSEAASQFLMEAANSATGEIARNDMDLALVIQVNGKSYEAKLNEPRKRTVFEEALTQLESAGLIVSVDDRRTLFRLTSSTYAWMDQS